MLLGVAEAARELNVSPRRVNAMIAAGRIKAERVGRSWIIQARDLPLARSTRPMSLRSAWTVLLEFNQTSWLSATERSRLKKRFAGLRGRDDRLKVFRSWMAGRGEPVRYRVPDKQGLLADARFIASGVSNDLSWLVGGSDIEGYVCNSNYEKLLFDHMLVAYSDGALIMRSCPDGIEAATSLMVAADLADRDDERCQEQGLRLLDEMLQELS